MRLIDADSFERYLMANVSSSEICDDCLQTFIDEMATDAPTVDAVPVIHAEWVERNEQTVVNGHVLFADGVVCGRCGYGNSGRNYCEYCGAKMGNAD